MKLAPLALTLIAGIAIGWFGRGLTDKPKSVTRSERRDVSERREDPDRSSRDDTTTADDREAEKTSGGHAGDGRENLAATKTEGEGEEAGKKTEKVDLANDPLAKFINSQRAQWKAFSSMQAKQKIKGLLAGLDLDPEVAAQIEAEILADVDRQMDKVVDMMIGTEELDPDAFTVFTGLPSDLSTEVEAKLGTFLSDDQIHDVRERVKKTYKEQLGAMADSQIAGMGIQDLTEDQHTRLREIYTQRDVMRDQFVNFSRLTRDRAKLREVMKDDAQFDAMFEQNMEPMRRSIQDVLNPEQYKKYQAFEENIASGFRVQLKMMQSLFENEEDASKDK